MLGHRRSVRRRTIELTPAGTVILQLESRADQAAQRAIETDLRWGTETNCAGTEVTEVWCASGQRREGKNCREQPTRAAQWKTAIFLRCHASSLCRAIPERTVDGSSSGAKSADSLLMKG